MQAYQVFDKGFAEAPCCFRRELQTRRQLLTKNDAVNRMHQVKGSAQHGLITTIEKYLSSWSIDSVKLGQHAKLAAHIVRGLYLAAKWRPSKNHFLRAQL